MFLPKIHRKNEFSKFCQDIFTEAEVHNKNNEQIENWNFIETLLASKSLLSADEIQDEVSTLILSVSLNVVHQWSPQLCFLMCLGKCFNSSFDVFRSINARNAPGCPRKSS